MTSLIKRYFLAGSLVLLAIILTQALGFALVVLKILPNQTGSLGIGHFLIVIIPQAFIFSVLAWYFQKYYRFSFFPFRGELTLKKIAYSILGLFLINVMIGLVVKYLGTEVKQLEVLEREAMKNNPYLFLLMVAFLAPLYEEFVFRGVILKTLYSKAEEEKTSGLYKLAAILFSSFLFSSVHFDLDAAIPIFLLGVYFSWLTIQTNSILLPSILHGVQNFLSGNVFLNDKLFETLGLSFLKIF